MNLLDDAAPANLTDFTPAASIAIGNFAIYVQIFECHAGVPWNSIGAASLRITDHWVAVVRWRESEFL